MVSGRFKRKFKSAIPGLVMGMVFLISLGALIYLGITKYKMPEFEREEKMTGGSETITENPDANPKPKLTGATFLQDLAVFPETCENSEVGMEVVLKDGRDGKQYRVKKMQDGNCWMLDTLKLEEREEALSSKDTDVTEEYVFDSRLKNEEGNNFKIKVPVGFYTWYVSTAGTGLKQTTGATMQSICPAGWTLPTNVEQKENAEGIRARNYKILLENSGLKANELEKLGFVKPQEYYTSDGVRKGAFYLLAQGVTGEASKVSLYNYDGFPEDSSLTGSKTYAFPIQCVAR